MKNNSLLTLFILCAFSLFSWTTQAQQNAIHVTSVDNAHEHVPGRTCHAHTNLQDKIQASPMLEERLRGMEEKTQRYMQEHRGSYGRATRVIPVYVHVIYRTSQENITTAQIQSQLDQLNADFAASNADYNPPADFAGVAAGNTNIQFTLANITRKSSTRTTWGTNDAMKSAAQGGVAAITPSTHLNMWVCNIGGGILGYAQFPGSGAASTDGVVMSPQYFGSNNYGSGYYLSAPFDKGRTTTHEVGHYLNLRHIWGDGGCNVDDLVDDTPVAGASNGGCPSSTFNSCSGGQRDMHMNYMDYTNDDCMYMFSTGQKDRMLACLATTRSSLGTVTGGGGGGGGGNTNCYAAVGLNLTTDNYGSETTWTLKNASGTTVESGSGYGNNTNYNFSWTLPNGTYTFTINDAYGDGICCSYGNGSYTLVGDGATAATGGNFGSSDVVTFCVETSAPACPTDIRLALTTDNYGSETTWDVRNASGTVVQSGSGYANNRSYNVTLNLSAGDYQFTIRDSYGDGICCSYGNGSYSVTADGQSIGSGGNFGSSDVVDICVGGANRTAARTTTTAIEEMTAAQVNLYPNPANNTINVDLSETTATFTGRIVDATGRNVWIGDLEAGQNAINIATLPAGLYYMAVVTTEGNVITKKFVKK